MQENSKKEVEIDPEYIYRLLEQGRANASTYSTGMHSRLLSQRAFTLEEIATLLFLDNNEQWSDLYRLAGTIKKSIYGNRVVVFAPLYLSNYCVNNCTYCGYRRDNDLPRRRLTMSEIAREVQILEQMGHKRLALEVGEDPRNCPLDYVLESIDTIYRTETRGGTIRRVNVNIAATTVEEYRRLKEAKIGTYILFQETYHRPTYQTTHPRSLKSDYDYHLNAFSRAMEAGIDDVGAGVLFGLYDWRFEVLALLLHNLALENRFGVGFHTISVPRIKRAEGVSLTDFPYQIDDHEFRRIVALLRLALPNVGLILSTRESAQLRKELIHYGISQVSAGSSTGVGGYSEDEASRNTNQFEVEDHRPALEVIKELIAEGFLPSYCTACYRKGRTGDRFMELAKSGNIQNVCQPNALMTLMEYAVGYGDHELIRLADELCDREIDLIKNEKIQAYTRESLVKIKEGKTDFFV